MRLKRARIYGAAITMSAKTKILFLRLPAEMHDAILAQAIAGDRSINKQGIRLLKKGIEVEKCQG